MFKDKLARALLVAGAVLLLGASQPAHAHDDATPYPRMAPLDQYLIADRDAEIALARTAAPDSVSRDATILILGRHVMRARFKEKTVLCVSCNGHGWAHSIIRSFGIPRTDLRSASTHPPPDPCCLACG